MCPAIDVKDRDVQYPSTDPTPDEEIIEQPSTTSVQPALLKCSRCKQDLPPEKFYKTTNYWCAGRGYSYVCRDCSKASATASRLKKQQEMKDAQ